MNVILQKNAVKSFSGNDIKIMSERLKLNPLIIELLFSRGIETEEDIKRFLYPDERNLYDPFLMKGMTEAVNRLKLSIEKKERLVIYGDYDVDGISSSAILSLFFKSKGLDVCVHIPSRTDEGYGLNITSVEKLADEVRPDLILTCDCGISGAKEIGLAQELGIDVIVTDHHEAGCELPDCIVVNPKQDGCAYPDKYLCGAGVAFKLVQAMSDDDSYMDFIDLAAIATIADIVPLVSENRLIVQLGLKKIGSREGNIGLRTLIDTYCSGDNVTSGDIAYKIAPRLNAAGRIGDAYRSFDLLITDDKTKILDIIADIENDNAKRKELCDKIYDDALIELKSENLVDNRAIILSNPNWSKGVTGIAAARLAGEFHRPAFIMVAADGGEVYKGTSRSIGGINIYEVLSAASDILLEFGGHSGAAGFSIAKSNIFAFIAAVNAYLAKLPDEVFLPTAVYDIDLPVSAIDRRLLDDLNLIEPTGNSNTKPYFKVTADTLTVSPCKNASHTSVVASRLQMYAFNYIKKNHFLLGSGSKELIVELCEGPGSSVNAYIKAVSPSKLYINNELAKANHIDGFRLGGGADAVYRTYERQELTGLMPDNIYGTLFICGCEETYNEFNARYRNEKVVIDDYIYLSEINNYSRIIVSPIFDGNFIISNYNRIIFLDPPMSKGVISYINSRSRAEVYIPTGGASGHFFAGVTDDRAVFAKYYNAIVSCPDISSANAAVYYKRLSARYKDLSACQFAVCTAVFEQLGFIKIGSDRLEVYADVKRQLSESEIYNKLQQVINAKTTRKN